MNSKAIVSGAIVLFAGNLLSALLGLVREVLLAAQYGAAADMDSYLFANTIPSILLTFASSIFTTGFIPLFIKQRTQHGPKEASLLFSNTINCFIVIILIVIAVCCGLSDRLSAFFADNPQMHGQIERLMWILLPGMLFFGLSFAQSAVLNSVNHFLTPSLMTVLNNVTVIAFMAAFHRTMGIYSVAVGFVLGNALQAAVQVPVLRWKGIRYKPYIRLKDESLRQLVSMSLPIVVMVLIDQSLVFSSRFFASDLDPGSASSLNYANRILILPVTLFGTALVNAAYPSAVQMWTENKRKEYSAIVSGGIKSLLLILVPVFLLSMTFATGIIRALFERGAFDGHATRMTASAFLVLSVCIVIMPVRDFFNKLFFSRSNLRTPINYSLLYTGGFIGACLALVPRIGYIGIAVSTVSSLLVAFSYLVLTYKRQYKEDRIGLSPIFLFKIASAAAVSSGAAYAGYWKIMRELTWGKMGEIAALAVFLALGMLLYAAFVKLWKIEEIDAVWAKLAAKLPAGKRGRARAAESKA